MIHFLWCNLSDNHLNNYPGAVQCFVSVFAFKNLFSIHFFGFIPKNKNQMVDFEDKP